MELAGFLPSWSRGDGHGAPTRVQYGLQGREGGDLGASGPTALSKVLRGSGARLTFLHALAWPPPVRRNSACQGRRRLQRDYLHLTRFGLSLDVSVAPNAGGHSLPETPTSRPR